MFGLDSSDTYNRSEHSQPENITQERADKAYVETKAEKPRHEKKTKQEPVTAQTTTPRNWKEYKMLLRKAILFTIERDKIECTTLQREFGIGFMLAMRLIENMKHFNLISPNASIMPSYYRVVRHAVDKDTMDYIMQECNMEYGIDRWHAQDTLISEARDNFSSVARYVVQNLITDTEHLHNTFGIYETSAAMILEAMWKAGIIGKLDGGEYYPIVDETQELYAYLKKGLAALPKTKDEEEEEAELRREILAEEEKRKEAVRRHERKEELRRQMAETGEIEGKPSRYIPQDIREAVLARDGYRCVRCGSTQYLEVDHIFPYSLGGTNELSNLQTLCRKCNAEKSNKLL